jgi:hypothetical protein
MLPPSFNPYEIETHQTGLKGDIQRLRQAAELTAAQSGVNPRYNRLLAGLGVWLVRQGKRLEAHHSPRPIPTVKSLHTTHELRKVT